MLLIPRHNQIEINHLYKLTEPVAWILPKQYGKIEYQPIIDDVLKESPNLKHIIQVRTADTKYHGLEKLIEEGELTKENLSAIEQKRPDPDEVSQIMPTGGTTGLPKASPRTHNDYLNNVEYHAYRWELTSQDTLMVITPVAHGMGLHWGIGGALFTSRQACSARLCGAGGHLRGRAERESDSHTDRPCADCPGGSDGRPQKI